MYYHIFLLYNLDKQTVILFIKLGKTSVINTTITVKTVTTTSPGETDTHTSEKPTTEILGMLLYFMCFLITSNKNKMFFSKKKRLIFFFLNYVSVTSHPFFNFLDTPTAETYRSPSSSGETVTRTTEKQTIEIPGMLLYCMCFNHFK